MEVQKEAQRIMTMSVWKMYHSRMQRGGLRLHRSLQLSLVMRNARDLYLSAKLEEEDEMGGGAVGTAEDFAGRRLDLPGEAPSPQHLEPAPPATPFPPAHQEAFPPSPPPSEAQPPPPPLGASADPEPMETQEEPEGDDASSGSRGLGARPSSQTAWSRAAARPQAAAKPSRKRRSSSLGKIGAAEAGLVPSKKAKLADEEGERQPQRQEGPFPGLARVLQDRFSGLILQPPPPARGADEPKGSCRQGDGVLSIMVRAVVAF